MRPRYDRTGEPFVASYRSTLDYLVNKYLVTRVLMPLPGVGRWVRN